ncbi:16S rRNA (cytidine(1402)-2'-O)-methyltransferase [Papillibacter cinnamivorans]|uniref:Ribosomal RNA small subunit methyltransferase I n=1 Tax=Papillibacter cinnamivorans DSM 12816 TaxID=1122930 RepID=A0A1W1ZZF1_9FIRM|nr:16S rRNA (cytidine(1402)-2'-O)-methyltransferase [Papillibacter cinnamivorans]SMC53807.1 16S rRNA (cytidine1402-2'-O)-methyltransferase [Papillibacter cinnamivorans DSM 12816]
MPGTLYLVATPIGNLGDISPRAVRALEEADFIAAEDTRVTLKLLNHLGIKKKLVSYYAHNRTEAGPGIRDRLLSGESCALVTDAGTPAVSDPGEDLVVLCAEAGIPVSAVPGPCALISALAVSGLPTGRFTFEGFLSTSRQSRKKHLASLGDETRTMIFYEAPHKLVSTLTDLLAELGDRRISVCRELTKLHEEILRTTLKEALSYFSFVPPRGEFVLVVEGASPPSHPALTLEEGAELVLQRRSEGLSLKDAARQVSEETGLPKNALYYASLNH